MPIELKAPKVVNRYKTKEYDEYIGRGSRWGNEFIIGVHGTRDEVIEKYRVQMDEKLVKGLVTEEDLLSLANKRIACFCAPQHCHGDVIADLVQLLINKLLYEEMGMGEVDSALNIEKYLLEFLQSNPSKSLPYHNNRHMKQVFALAVRMLLRETGELKQYVQHFVPLTFSTLLHDYGHSGGKLSDEENIKIALEAVAKAIAECPEELPEGLEETVRRTILCTEFPFKHEPDSLVEKIMRDADILYATMENDPTVIMEGLRKEMEVSQGRKISYTEMYDNQVTFATNAKLYTKRGKQLWDENFERFLKEMEDYRDEQVARGKQ